MRASLFLALAACGTNGDDDQFAPVDCTKVTNVDTYIVGLEKMGRSGMLDFKLMSITPAPPIRGDNDWTVQVASMTSGVVGAPIDGAQLSVTPYMPAHMHVSGVTTVVSAGTDPGTYKLSPVNMAMNGVWEVTIRATTATVTDTAVYSFCVP